VYPTDKLPYQKYPFVADPFDSHLMAPLLLGDMQCRSVREPLNVSYRVAFYRVKCQVIFDGASLRHLARVIETDTRSHSVVYYVFLVLNTCWPSSFSVSIALVPFEVVYISLMTPKIHGPGRVHLAVLSSSSPARDFICCVRNDVMSRSLHDQPS
jgi:hypothetical protein